MNKMKAALFYGEKRDMRLETVDIPQVGEGDVLLKVRASGICGSDVRSYVNGIEERYKIPIIFGHEVTGEVVAMGSRVQQLQLGERVVVAPIYGCGRCEFCLLGLENLCDEVVVFGCTLDGGYAEYMLIPEKGVERGVLVPLPSSLSDEAGTLIEVVSCCLHGQRRAGLKPGDKVVIFGAGPIGLVHLLVSKKMGAGMVGLIDFIPQRLRDAQKFGADFVVNASDSEWRKQVLQILGNNGASLVITAAPTVSSIEYALQLVRKGGTVLIFGGLPAGNTLSLDPNFIHYREVNVIGSIDATLEDFYRAVQWSPYLGLERFVTHRFSLDRVLDAMGVAVKKEGLKVVLVAE